MSRRARRRKKRSQRSKPTRKPEQSPAVTIDTIEDTTGGTQGEVGEVDLTQKRLRSKIKTVEEYIEAGVFTPDQAKSYLRQMGSIVAKDDTGRFSIRAYLAILARAKIAIDLDLKREDREASAASSDDQDLNPEQRARVIESVIRRKLGPNADLLIPTNGVNGNGNGRQTNGEVS